MVPQIELSTVNRDTQTAPFQIVCEEPLQSDEVDDDHCAPIVSIDSPFNDLNNIKSAEILMQIQKSFNEAIESALSKTKEFNNQ